MKRRSRGRGLAPALVLVAGLLSGCSREPAGDPLQSAISAALDYLVSKQDADGAWRSEIYGSLRDGPTLTPTMLKCLSFGSVENAKPRAKARAYLRELLPKDGAPFRRLELPVSTAALAAIVLARSPEQEDHQAAAEWIAHLRSWQLTEALGWDRSDSSYGGFGYSVRAPQKPAPDSEARLPFEADLSSTLFAVGALRIFGATADDPAIRKALVFVQRCQNFGDVDGDPQFDDGGFATTPHRDDQNKAGVAGVDRHGRTRFYSYGSATADGLRLLVRCGLGADHPRVMAARAWLEEHFSASTHPGTFLEAREPDREAPFFYYCWSVAHAFQLLGIREIERDGRPVDWTALLVEELLRRQGADGSYRNRFSFVKEDDPLIATALATGALAVCELVNAD